MRFSSYHSSWDSGMFSEKYNDNWQILTFDDLWWPQYCSKVKNDWNTFKRTHWELSTAFYRVFLALLVFELEVGGNICPPSLGRSWPRPPLGRGLTLFLAGSAGTRNWRGGAIRPPFRSQKLHIAATNGERRLIGRLKIYNFYIKHFQVRSILRSPEVINDKMFWN